MNAHDDTNTHSHSTNQVSQAGEVLTRFYRGVDALPSISGLPHPLPLFLCAYFSYDERCGRSGGSGVDYCFLLNLICTYVKMCVCVRT